MDENGKIFLLTLIGWLATLAFICILIFFVSLILSGSVL